MDKIKNYITSIIIFLLGILLGILIADITGL
jgi:hypothetical protein